jgi:hypothetical protein
MTGWYFAEPLDTQACAAALKHTGETPIINNETATLAKQLDLI